MSQQKRVCSDCRTPLSIAAKFCGKCGQSFEDCNATGSCGESLSEALLGSATDSHTHPHSITWDIDIPLVTNAYVLRSMLKVTLGSGVLVGMLVSFLMAVQGDWGLIPSMLGIFVVGGLGFFPLSVLIMLLLFGNRFRARFIVSTNDVR